MNPHRRPLPQLGNRLFITDSGLETTLIFHHGIDLPHFASFTLLDRPEGRQLLQRYFTHHVEIARAGGTGIVLEAPTWRANTDWGRKLGYDEAALERVNRAAIAQLSAIRAGLETAATPVVVSGNLGPRGDGYHVETRMCAAEARDYHARQIATFADTDADLVAAFTMNYVEEALGIVLAARDAAMPVAISFTVETDGRLPSGMALAEAIERCDAETGAYPAYYMINCAHPAHFSHVLREAGAWRERLRGLRANASRLSHAELDACTELDAGNPRELGQQFQELRALLPQLNVLGGCCGTDHRHIEQIGAACRLAA